MYRIASIVLIALALVACGGGDDDSNDNDSDPTSSSGGAPTATVAGAGTTPASTVASGVTPAASSATEPAAAETAPAESTVAESTPAGSTGGKENDDGAPTHASSDFPDVRAPLEVGSSGEVVSMDPDPFANTDSREENSKVKVTINEILDPAEIEGALFPPEAGNRWFAINITMEATGSEIANTGVWTLATTDGTEYTNLYALGDTPDITYGSIEPGATAEGLIIFEIPEDATVQWILMSPTIFVGENLVFVN